MSRRGVVFALVAVVGLSLLASATAGGGGQVQLVVASDGRPGCTGFVVESPSGAVRRCVSVAGGQYPGKDPPGAAAADGSVVFSEWYPIGNIAVGTRTELVHPNGDAMALDTPPDFDMDQEASISADGSRVAFLRVGDSSKPTTIYVVNADGSGLHVAAAWNGAYLSAPAISPDGGSIAYWCVSPLASDPAYSAASPRRCGPLPDGSYRRGGLMLMNADGSDKRMIVIGSAAGTPVPLSWSPNGRWLTTDGCAASVPCYPRVFAYRTDGSDLFNYLDPSREVNRRQAAHEPGTSVDAPQFCGSSSRILYDSGSRTYLINRDGTHRQRTTLSPPYGFTATLPPPFGGGGSQPGHPVCTPPAGGGGPPPTLNVMRVTVPAVRTLSYAAAKRRLRHAGFHVSTFKRAYSSRIRRGHVIAQYPRAGAHAHRSTKEGPSVELVLSRGRRS